jgi:hypothetical protein
VTGTLERTTTKEQEAPERELQEDPFMGQELRSAKSTYVIQKNLTVLQRVNEQLPYPAEGDTIFLLVAVRMELSAIFPDLVCTNEFFCWDAVVM